MTMSRFRQQPRVGHIERLKRIIGYLAYFPHGSLRFGPMITENDAEAHFQDSLLLL